MRKLQFSNDEIYHIWNRGVDKRTTFFEEKDYIRFLSLIKEKSKGTVQFLGYCFMRNHYHFLVRQLIEKGVSRFMHKIGIAYTKSFNGRYGRSGSLFKSTFQASHIDRDGYLLHMFRYVHLNPLIYLFPDWKQNGVLDIDTALKFLKEYKWSSYRDFNKYNNFNFVDDSLLRKEFKTAIEYDNFLVDWLKFGCPRKSIHSFIN